jgi:2-succinyl-6-hydroxy-2,4-cyclohexadiene-1-carboxylate synthase
MSAIVLLHGFTGAPASWAAVLEALPPRTRRRATTLALGGHAPEVVDEPRTDFAGEVARLAARVAELAASGDGRVHLAGYSMGARLALHVALAAPARLRALTLLGVHPGIESEAERAERREADRRWIRLLVEEGIEAFARAWEQQPLFATAPGSMTARIRRAHDPQGLARALARLGTGEMPPTWDALPRLGLPVALVVGQRDPKFCALAERARALLPSARLSVVAGAGHQLLAEAPDAVAAAITELEEESP